MRNQLILVAVLLCLCSSQLPAQGLTTTATKDDWEEINFAFDRAILTDGYPSLLRLAELLSNNTDYSVKLEGHADNFGSEQYNIILSEKRAQTVRDFLVKYGVGAGQISIVARGKGAPKVSNDTNEGRWINRRVVVTLTALLSKLDSRPPIWTACRRSRRGASAGVGHQKPLKQAFWGSQRLNEGVLRRAA